MTTHANGQPALCGTTYGTTAIACTRLVGHDDSPPVVTATDHRAPTGDDDGFWVWQCEHRGGHIGAHGATCSECGQAVAL